MITKLGFPVASGDVLARLPILERAGETPLVADHDGIVGCLTWHVMPVLHRPTPVGRVSMLIVAAHARGRGVGKTLVVAAETRMRERGCGLIEVTSNMRLVEAHAFYERIGYERTSLRFAKTLHAARVLARHTAG